MLERSECGRKHRCSRIRNFLFRIIGIYPGQKAPELASVTPSPFRADNWHKKICQLGRREENETCAHYPARGSYQANLPFFVKGNSKWSFLDQSLRNDNQVSEKSIWDSKLILVFLSIRRRFEFI
jgi:hypothetical protein